MVFKSMLCDANMLDTCHYTLLKFIEPITARINCTNYGLWVMMYVNVCSSFVTHVLSAVGCDIVGRCARVGAGGIKEICVPSSQFCLEPKTALETKIFKKKKNQGSEKAER